MTKKNPSDKRKYRSVDTHLSRQEVSELRQESRSGGRMIGAFIPSLTRQAFRRKSPLFVRLILDWEQIIGPELAAQSEPCRLRLGVLTVRCSGPTAMVIQYAIPRILESINTACGLHGDAAIHQLKIVQDRTMAARPSSYQRKTAPPPPVVITDMEEGPLRDALERLGRRIAARSH